MSRPAQPKDRVGSRYIPGPPKRIALTIYRVGGARDVVLLSTLDARFLATGLFDAIDTAEADKVALRGTGVTAPKPKRTRPRSTGVKAPPRPSRLRRVEQAALHLNSLLSDRERLPPAAREALDALADALGVKPKGLSR